MIDDNAFLKLSSKFTSNSFETGKSSFINEARAGCCTGQLYC